MNKKSIAIIGLKGLPAFGGAANVGENIIEYLKNDYDFTVYSVASHTSLKTGSYKNFYQIVFQKFPIKKLNIYYYYFRSVLHCLFKKHYDLVHVHHTDISVIIPILRLKYKTIITSHGSMLKLKGINFKYGKIDTFFLSISEKFMKYAHQVTAVSKKLSVLLSDRYAINVKYIPNGIELFDFDQIRPSTLVKNDDYILFGAGRIIPTKGCHILLHALNQMEYKGKVLIVGDIAQDNNYTQNLYENSKDLDIVFLGMVKDKNELRSIIKQTKLFIYPSSLEAMSMMLLEVAACKVPIICSDIGENVDIFGTDTVQYFKVDNHLDLEEKIKWALDNYNICQAMANSAFDRLKREFNWTNIATQYSELYSKILVKIN